MKQALTATVSCCGEQHEIVVYPNGAVLFKGHNNVSVKAMTVQFSLNKDVSNTCFVLAASLMGQAPLTTGPGWLLRLLETYAAKRNARSHAHAYFDFCSIPLDDRLGYSSYFINEAAYKALNGAKFKTSESGHLVSIIHNDREVEVTGDFLRVTTTGLPKKVSHVAVRTNMKRWAKIHRQKAGLVDDHFVVCLVKSKSKDEMAVLLAKQSRGYSVQLRPATIRRGSDSVWRIHSWE